MNLFLKRILMAVVVVAMVDGIAIVSGHCDGPAPLKSFHVRFMGYQELNSRYLFQVFLPDKASDKQLPLLKKGDSIEGYKIIDFVMKHEPDSIQENGQTKQITADHSELILQPPDLKEAKIVLPYRVSVQLKG